MFLSAVITFIIIVLVAKAIKHCLLYIREEQEKNVLLSNNQKFKIEIYLVGAIMFFYFSGNFHQTKLLQRVEHVCVEAIKEPNEYYNKERCFKIIELEIEDLDNSISRIKKNFLIFSIFFTIYGWKYISRFKPVKIEKASSKKTIKKDKK